MAAACTASMFQYFLEVIVKSTCVNLDVDSVSSGNACVRATRSCMHASALTSIETAATETGEGSGEREPARERTQARGLRATHDGRSGKQQTTEDTSWAAQTSICNQRLTQKHGLR
jgi:hypothetical protein